MCGVKKMARIERSARNDFTWLMVQLQCSAGYSEVAEFLHVKYKKRHTNFLVEYTTTDEEKKSGKENKFEFRENRSMNNTHTQQQELQGISTWYA